MNSSASLKAHLDRTVNLATQVLASPAVPDLEALEQSIENLNTFSRESFQLAHWEKYDAIASRLEEGKGLQQGDREMLELLFAGPETAALNDGIADAHGLQEIARVVEELRKVRDNGGSGAADLLRVQGLCASARHVLPEALYQARERERIQRLRENLNGDLRGENGRLVARMIRDLITSPHR